MVNESCLYHFAFAEDQQDVRRFSQGYKEINLQYHNRQFKTTYRGEIYMQC